MSIVMNPRKFVAAFIITSALVPSFPSTTPAEAAAEAQYAIISVSEARTLVRDALDGRGKEIYINENHRPDDPDFFFFEATWPNPTGSPVIGYFAVNRWTGDVWDQGCRSFSSWSIRARQAQIREKAGIPTAVFRELHTKRPIC
jgi:hypothetical protein